MSSEGSSTPTWWPYAAIACTVVLWASAFVAIRDLGDDFSPGALSLGRLVVGSLALGVFALRRGRGHGLPRPTRAQWGPLVAIGVLWFGVYNLALNEGEHRIDAGTASILVQVSPLLIAVLAALLLGEHFDRRLALGLVIAFGGGRADRGLELGQPGARRARGGPGAAGRRRLRRLGHPAEAAGRESAGGADSKLAGATADRDSKFCMNARLSIHAQSIIQCRRVAEAIPQSAAQPHCRQLQFMPIGTGIS